MFNDLPATGSLVDVLLRLLVATVAGMIIGLNRDLRGKPVGVRTLGLVSLGSALAILAGTHFGAAAQADAASRVIQGVLTGVGFIGAGVIFQQPGQRGPRGLTTAATVWIAAVLGIVSGLGAWTIVIAAGLTTLFVLMFGGAIERLAQRALGRREAGPSA